MFSSASKQALEKTRSEYFKSQEKSSGIVSMRKTSVKSEEDDLYEKNLLTLRNQIVTIKITGIELVTASHPNNMTFIVKPS